METSKKIRAISKILQSTKIVVVIAILVTILLPFSVIKKVTDIAPKYDLLGFGTEANSWLIEHTDLRKDISRRFKYLVFHLSPTDSLQLGKNGWIFYTLNNNLDIAKGTYPLGQDILDNQAVVFSNVKKYYELMDADFYYLLYPAKTAIYPEFISGDNLTVGETPVDIVANNLKQKTDVNIIAPKWDIINNKSRGKLYMEKDEHASDLGAYVVYNNIISEISKKSKINIKPIPVEFIDGQYEIGANKIAGVTNLFGVSETGPVAVYDAKAVRVTEGKYYERIMSICTNDIYKSTMVLNACAIYENPEAMGGTLLIYGTSMFVFDNLGEDWQLTRYLAENFKKVVYVGIYPQIMPELDSVVKPDIVLVESPERIINNSAIYTTRVPIIADIKTIEAIPQTKQQNSIGNNGMWLDYFGSQLLQSIPDYIEIGEVDTITMSGWAEDANTQLPLSALYLRLGNKLIKCNYGNVRDGLSEAFGYSEAANSAGFTVEIPKVFFNGVKEMEFIEISTDGKYKYAPVVYKVR
jgi:hypothetical protein